MIEQQHCLAKRHQFLFQKLYLSHNLNLIQIHPSQFELHIYMTQQWWYISYKIERLLTTKHFFGLGAPGGTYETSSKEKLQLQGILPVSRGNEAR